MNKAAFETYVETHRVPQLHYGDAVMLDNLSLHKSPKAARYPKPARCLFLYRPADSPDLNPIETAFPDLKAHLRRTGARTVSDLQNEIASVLELLSPEECQNCFTAAGDGINR